MVWVGQSEAKQNTKPIAKCETYCQCFDLIRFYFLIFFFHWMVFFSCCRCQVVGNFTVLVLPLTHAWNILQKRMFLFKCRFARSMQKKIYVNWIGTWTSFGWIWWVRYFLQQIDSLKYFYSSIERNDHHLHSFRSLKMVSTKWTLDSGSFPIIFTKVVMRCIFVYSDEVVVFQQLQRAQKKLNPIEIKRTICLDVCFS